MNHEPLQHEFSRRGVLRAGGITFGLAALLSACVDDAQDASPARVGDAPTPPTLPEGVRTDATLFRTATSLHFSIIDAHNMAKKVGGLDADQTALVESLIAANQAAIEELQSWTTTAGGEQWTCANPRFDRVVLGPIEDRIVGRPKQGNEEDDVAPSDDANRDALTVIHGMETLAAEMHQSLVPQLSLPDYRGAVIAQGALAARRSAVAALTINEANLVVPAAVQATGVAAPSTTVEATTTTTGQNLGQVDEEAPAVATADAVPVVEKYAIPSQFGLLAAIQLALGAPNAGTQFTINIETPSLNSFIYEYLTDADCVAADT
jgi:hypothetical protein